MPAHDTVEEVAPAEPAEEEVNVPFLQETSSTVELILVLSTFVVTLLIVGLALYLAG